MAKDVSFLFDQGSKFAYTVAVTFDGVVVDITGWSARLQIRPVRQRSAEELAIFTTAVGQGLAIVGPQAQIQIDIPAADSEGWDWTEGQYDLTLYTPSLEAYRVIQGKAVVNHQVTVPAQELE